MIPKAAFVRFDNISKQNCKKLYVSVSNLRYVRTVEMQDLNTNMNLTGQLVVDLGSDSAEDFDQELPCLFNIFIYLVHVILVVASTSQAVLTCRY